MDPASSVYKPQFPAMFTSFCQSSLSPSMLKDTYKVSKIIMYLKAKAL